MGVLTEIGAMRCVVVVLAMWWGCAAGCPSLCSCRGALRADGEAPPTPGEPLRLRCGGPPALISELKEVDFTDITGSVVSLNMSGNAISTLSRDLHLPNLQKLDLSRNQISLIESDAFYNITGVSRLDLSHNQISAVSSEMFKGLVNLERLYLNHNLLTTLAPGTFHHLLALKQLDITENRLVCDCALVWVGAWVRASGVRLQGGPRCAAPAALAGRALRKLRVLLDLAACGAPPPAALLAAPARDQLVFEGDALTLTCSAPFASALHGYELRWHHPSLETCDVNITSTDVLEEGVAETAAFFPNITTHHAGDWTCVYVDDGRGRHNRTIRVTVLSNATRYCATDVSVDNKGLYSWPQVLLNHTAEVPCRAGAGVATRPCGAEGAWLNANTSQCAYISNVTKLLQQFALLDLGLVQYSAVNATERLAALIRENTYPLALVDDPDDVMFVARAVDNYMHYVDDEPDLGSALLDVISAVMNVTPSVMAAAEDKHGACTELVRAAELLAPRHNNKQKSNLAVESFPVRAGFGGATCAWYSAAAGSTPRLHCTTTNRTVARMLTFHDALIHASVQVSPQGAGSTPRLHCTTTNRTVARMLTFQDALIHASVQVSPQGAGSTPRLHCTTTNRTVARMLTFQDALIHASVQIPASLQFALARGSAASLVVSVFLDAALFPLLPEDEPSDEHRAKDYYGRSTKRQDMNMEITSPVVSVQLHNGSLSSALIEPVIFTLRAAGCGAAARCALWDPATKRWQHNSTECAVLHVSGCTWVVALPAPGVVALLARAERGYYGARTHGARFKVSHPAVYVGSLVLGGCLAAAATTYAAAFPALLMPRRAKHALLNTWLAQAALCFLYTLGIYQTEDVRLCRALGLLIHYLSLCCLLWMCVSAHVMYKWVTRRERPPPDEPPDAPVRKPVLGLYLSGWGIALIVCGISGAVNLKDYAGYAQCFLSTAAALTALLVPGGILLLFLSALFLLIRCTIRDVNVQLSEGTQATEHVDLELWEPQPEAERRSIKSEAESETEDTEHTPIVQLRAQAIVLGLHLAAWGSGAVAVYRPLPAYLPYQEDICSIVYAICATVLGTFTLFFYGIARSDVRAQWSMMHCYLQKSKQCCRNRSVFDSNRQNLPPSAPPVPLTIPNDNRSRSGSRSSNRTNSKTNNSAIYKAGAELNGQTLQKDVLKNTNGKSPNINLVVLHRQQYRSNNSMLTCPETASVGPEAFYNPNQMNVAKKFFKKQRQNMKRNCLELPMRRDFDNDSHVSLPLPSREAYGVANIINSGSKVNNTNIHVERPNGIKEPRHANNPNLLDEDADYKSYSTDRKSWADNDKVMNIYTNVPETRVPTHTHHVVGREPDTRTVSQQCSLEYSSASELAPHSASDRTLDTSPTELTEPPEPSAAAETTDTDSFGLYVDCRRADPDPATKSLHDISEEGTMRSDDAARSASPPDGEGRGSGEADGLLPDPEAPKEFKTYDFETCSTNASSHGENESDIYCPNYQVSEVSIRSHGLYAPSPSSMCPGAGDISFSAEDVSHAESQYVNFDPGWRSEADGGRDSRASLARSLDELYTQITARRAGAAPDAAPDALDCTAHSDVTLRPDSAGLSDADSGRTATLEGTLV
ncbi:adhesion G protein-coupled receptor A3 [Cydia pomonella]|uniref:adhesion G protein-coupled receptor A3 n=1 Tax=Cydia pomonella TaxID=82600 RepID=UPI002ADDD263|nr:adhesion G protein-coupled receptor A3 [Cydia pomonella]